MDIHGYGESTLCDHDFHFKRWNSVQATKFVGGIIGPKLSTSILTIFAHKDRSYKSKSDSLDRTHSKIPLQTKHLETRAKG